MNGNYVALLLRDLHAFEKLNMCGKYVAIFEQQKPSPSDLSLSSATLGVRGQCVLHSLVF